MTFPGVTLANLPTPPDSVPINMLIPIPGTRLADAPQVDPIDFVRIVALARMLLPRSYVRLSAGRSGMSDELHAFCFFAGANSIFAGDRLLTTGNPDEDHDSALLRRLGLRSMHLEPGARNASPDTAQENVCVCGASGPTRRRLALERRPRRRASASDSATDLE